MTRSREGLVGKLHQHATALQSALCAISPTRDTPGAAGRHTRAA